MNKVCVKSKTRLKKDASHRKANSVRNPGSSFGNDDLIEIGESGTVYGCGSKDVTIQELGCGDVTELLISSQEQLLYSSQEVCSEQEVRWDYQSPETVKKLKKCRGQYSSQEVKRIVANFTDSHVQPENSSLHSLKLYLPTKDEVTLARESRLQKEKEKLSKKCRRRLGKEDSVQQMIKFLHDQASKPVADDKTECTRSSECSSSDPRPECENSASVSSNLTSSSTVDGDDNLWSDDDLFKDNSFLMEATQNPEKFLNSVQNQTAVSKSCSPEMTFKSKSLLVDSFVIPPSCGSKQSSIMGAKPLLNVPTASSHSTSSMACAIGSFQNFPRSELNNNISGNVKTSVPVNVLDHGKTTNNYIANFKPLGSTNSMSDSEYSSNNVSATASMCNNSNKGELNNKIPDSQSVIVNPPPKALFKTSFRKFNSFQIDKLSPRIRKNSDSSKEKQDSKLNSSFRKTLSFDSSFSLSRNSDQLQSRNSNQLQSANKQKEPDFVKNSPKLISLSDTNIIPEPNDAAVSKMVGLKLQSEIVSCVPATQEDGFDVSLPEDAFQALAVFEEIFSQGNVAVVTATNIVPKSDEKVSGCNSAVDTKSPPRDFSLNRLRSSTSASKMTSVIPTSIKSATSCKPTDTVRKDILEANSRQLVPEKILPSPVRSVTNLQNRKRMCTNSPTQAYYKKTFSIQKDSSHHQRTEKHMQPSIPCSSTPVKNVRPDVSYHVGDGQTNAATDYSGSFLDSVFDDSFTNDAAMFESQILPVLEKMEAEALLTQKAQSCPVKCSSKEIEQKRQTAMQKRSLRLSQKNMDSGLK